jgi:hypothetical protein
LSNVSTPAGKNLRRKHLPLDNQPALPARIIHALAGAAG